MKAEGQRVSEGLLSRLSEFVTGRMGLYFAKERWRDLERGITSAAKEFGFDDVASCVRWLLTSSLTREQIEVLAGHLTVGETYFFRDKKAFEVLERRILGELIASRREKEKSLRIWSAGCATGEEAYSIAILLKRMIPDINEWNITILATDINPLFLRRASESIYTDWSFRDVPAWVREHYFTKTKQGKSELLPHIREMVTFCYHNLVEDTYPSLLNNTNAMDIILCRNVLMYFSPEIQRRVIKKLHSCLKQGGWLLVSPSESSHQLFREFAADNESGAIFYRKDAACRIQRPEMTDRGSAAVPGPAADSWLQPPHQEPEIRDEGTEPDLGSVPDLKPLASALPQQPTVSDPDPLESARELYGKGCYADATEKILASPSLSKDDARAMELMARAFANLGKLGEALKWCEKSVATAKMDPGGHYLLAMILQEQGRLDDAAASLKRALYIDQDFVPALFALGNLARQQGKQGESARHFRNAKALLVKRRQDDILAETDGITAGRLMEIIESTTHAEAAS